MRRAKSGKGEASATRGPSRDAGGVAVSQRTYPLADAAMAHEEVENRTVAGKTLLLV
jgi:hypothetical protein